MTQVLKGVDICFHYQSMSDLDNFDSNSFDLVWSGESIEHITREEAHKVFEGVCRILVPGGHFCLDTPNRKLTKLHVGEENYIHPEHKVEYYYDEFINEFKEYNLKINASLGIVHMPESIANESFEIEEYKRNRMLNDDPENSYMFYIDYVKI